MTDQLPLADQMLVTLAAVTQAGHTAAAQYLLEEFFSSRVALDTDQSLLERSLDYQLRQASSLALKAGHMDASTWVLRNLERRRQLEPVR